MKKFVRIFVIIWLFLSILIAVTDIIKCISGKYIKIDATIKEVNYFKVDSSKKGGSYNRANGYVMWEYNGVVFESDRRIDFPADAVEGDSEPIWIDSETGEYVIFEGILYSLFSCGVNILMCIIILKLLRYRESSVREKQIIT